MLIPAHIKEFDSQGEKIFFNKLKSDSRYDDLIVLHSVFLAKHLTSISGEIDFLLLYPNHGVFALELKHGRVERIDGVWKFYNRKGEMNTSTKGPFRQVNDTMHSLRRWILENCHKSKKAKIEKILFGTGVILSGIDEFIDVGAEGFQWQILYREFIVHNRLKEYFDNLSRGWHNERSSQKWYRVDESRPSKDDCFYLLKLLRGDFSQDYSILNKIRDNYLNIQSFTDSQLDSYSHIFYNDRNLITGPAGTGKTILAYQLAVELIKMNKRILFLCFNVNLGNKIKTEFSKIPESSNSFLGNYHSFLLTNCKTKFEDSDSFYKENLPLEFLLQNEKFDTYDYLIIDESQDLINETNLLVFDHILSRGLEKGHWSFFGDFEKQNLYEKDSNIELLNQFFFAKYKPLKINCRNSLRIMNQNNLMTGVSYDDCLNNLNQEKVTIKFPSEKNMIKVLDQIILNLIDENVSPDKITILSPENSFKGLILESSQYRNLILEGKLQFGTIHSFKGLENDFIIVAGFQELISDKAKQLLYIAISRAIFKLYMIFKKSLESEFSYLISNKY